MQSILSKLTLLSFSQATHRISWTYNIAVDYNIYQIYTTENSSRHIINKRRGREEGTNWSSNP